MNNQLQEYARSSLKKGLHLCDDRQQRLFRQMYAKGDLEKAIESIVDNMPADKLDHAMQQVSRTLSKVSRR